MDRAAARILIVDDEPQLLKVMTKFLARLGYGVVPSGVTEDAWSQFQADPAGYALAIVDMTMEGMSSEELMRRMRECNPSICLIACSGYPTDVSEFEMPGKPAVFLQKPFTPEMLSQTIAALLD
jgi:DNA-binding NtrC family response regulator